MSERLEFARPMMRRSTGLDANQAWRQLLEECQDVAALQLTADEHLAFRVDAVHLKDRLGNVETDGGNRSHGWLRIVGALTAPTSVALRPVEEPSTASLADIAIAEQPRSYREEVGAGSAIDAAETV